MKAKSRQISARHWLWLVPLAFVVAMLGGSSRPDQVQLAALRPLTALFLIPAFYLLSREQLRKARILIILLGLLALWMVLQLVPLPPAVWQSLPRRDAIAELDLLVGLDGLWRPISLAPARGWNAFASLIVPVTALLMALAVRASPRILLFGVAGLGLLDAALGILQVLGGRSSPLYFYSKTNFGSAVGIFANENHSAVLSAVACVIIVQLALTSRSAREPSFLRPLFPATFILVLVATLIGGSRTGVVVGLLSVVASGMMIWLGLPGSRRRARDSKVLRWADKYSKFVVLAAIGMVGALLSLFFFSGRAEGVEEILSTSPFEDLRLRLWPIILEMARAHWLVGTGFGSFEDAYHIYEPSKMLFAQYINQAHNDWAQIIIEGGLPATFLLVSLLVWVLLSIRRITLNESSAAQHFVFWVSVFGILAASSAIDYPLRAPGWQLVATWILLALGLEGRKANPGG